MSTGASTSNVEVVDISQFGIWLLHRGTEYFLDYERFPWFREGSVAQVFEVMEESPEHLRWPGLDVDLSLSSIRDPEAYPLVAGREAG